MKKDMRWKVAQIGMLTTMLAMESILPQGHIVDARHQTAQYRIEEDMELAGLSSYVRGGQAEGAYVSETIARVHDQWQQKTGRKAKAAYQTAEIRAGEDA